MTKTPNAWIAVDHELGSDQRLTPYSLALIGDRSLYQAIAEDDWALILNPQGVITRVGRALRIRSDLETTTLYFDRVLSVDPGIAIGTTSLLPPASGNVGRLQWADFVETLSKWLHTTISGQSRIRSGLYPGTAAIGGDGRSSRPSWWAS